MSHSPVLQHSQSTVDSIPLEASNAPDSTLSQIYGPIFIEQTSSSTTFSFIAEMDRYFRDCIAFKAVLQDLSLSKAPIELGTVELIHVAEWGQYFLLQDNPRLFLRIRVPDDDIFLEDESIYRLRLYLSSRKSSTKSAPQYCIMSRSFRGSDQHANKIITYSSDEGKVLEKSVGQHKEFVAVYKAVERSARQQWRLSEIRLHISLFHVTQCCISKEKRYPSTCQAAQ